MFMFIEFQIIQNNCYDEMKYQHFNKNIFIIIILDHIQVSLINCHIEKLFLIQLPLFCVIHFQPMLTQSSPYN